MKPYFDRLMIVAVLAIGAWWTSRPKVVERRVTLPNPTVEVPGPVQIVEVPAKVDGCLLESVPWVRLGAVPSEWEITLPGGRTQHLDVDEAYMPLTLEAQLQLKRIWDARTDERAERYGYKWIK